ncbi:hypothetical protein [Cryobacterium arcticum]|uniref:Uncharacterized protein n=1 Tax=Cryobacterium arcticum TaxID=670052 RepID=A0A317ZTS8_9MICO|nr:hypothetical protein [Cryobacterium arcticum]PXA70638.1 hypothetical protein CTB96_05990 [Cryobacterium arcticum]
MTRRAPKSLRIRIRLAAAGAVLVAGALAGCTGSTPSLPAGTAGQLQSAVLTVSTAAAAGDYAGAQAALDSLKALLAVATEENRIAPGRASDIQAAIALVEADLAAALSIATPTPRATPQTVPPSTRTPATPRTQEPTPEAPAPTTPAPTPTEQPSPQPTEPEPTPTTVPTTPAPTPEPTDTAEPGPTAEPDDNSGPGNGAAD